MRNIYLQGQITNTLINDIIKQILYYDNISNEDINIYISSTGGDLLASIMLLDIFKIVSSKINTIVLDMAFSAAAVILSGGDKRYAHKNSFIMIHELATFSANMNFTEYIHEELIDILAKNTKNKKKFIKNNISFDNYLTAEESLKFNIIDEII